MRLAEYIKKRKGLTIPELTEAIGLKSQAQVRQWQHGYSGRLPSPINCVAIERATKGVVTRRDLRPNDYHLIWPELAPAKKGRANG